MLDDWMGRWIQELFDAWESGNATEGHQFCVYARCGLQLLMPRLAAALKTSGKMLEAWKRVIPV